MLSPAHEPRVVGCKLIFHVLYSRLMLVRRDYLMFLRSAKYEIEEKKGHN